MIIATDLDGTLLESSTSVSAENLEALKRLAQSGHTLAIATGRTFNEIPPALLHNKSIRYIIYSNGAAVYKRGEGVVHSRCIDPKTAAGVLGVLGLAKTFTEVYSRKTPFVEASKFNERAFARYRIDPDYLPELRRSRVGVDSLYDVISDGAEMFDVFFRDPAEREECRRRIISRFHNLRVTSSMSNNLEITAAGADKGTALIALCRLANEDISSCVVCGDSENDVSMFLAAGRAYAVSNACERLKKISSGVICSNTQNVMEDIERLVPPAHTQPQKKIHTA